MDCTDPITWGRRARLLITAFALTFTLAACIHDDDDDDDDNGGGGGVVKNNTCVITHNGGAAQLTVSSIRVTPAGNGNVVETRTLTGNDDNSTTEENNAITACGNFVYAVQRTSQSIARLEVNDDGTLDPLLPDVNHPGLFVLQCLPDEDRLLAISPVPALQKMTVTAYSVGANGDLAVVNPVVDLPFAGGLTFENLAPTAVHPTTGELWIVGYFSNNLGNNPFSRAFRVGIDAMGRAEIREGPTDIGGQGSGFEIGFGNNATQLAMAGLVDVAGSSTATWDLPAGVNLGNLPSMGDQQINVGGNFAGGITLAARDGDRVFYQGHGGPSIRIYEGKPGIVADDYIGDEATFSGLRVLKLLHDDEVLFSIGKIDGDITLFEVSPDGKTLTETPDMLNIMVGSVKSLTTVPCI